MAKLSVIIPVYNEKDTIDAILDAVLKVDLSAFSVDKEVIVVDDCLTDGTLQALAKREEKGVRGHTSSKN